MNRISRFTRYLKFLTISSVGLLIVPEVLRADAIVVSKAASAPTIAEFFIESDEIRMEMEIGLEDRRSGAAPGRTDQLKE